MKVNDYYSCYSTLELLQFCVTRPGDPATWPVVSPNICVRDMLNVQYSTCIPRLKVWAMFKCGFTSNGTANSENDKTFHKLCSDWI